MPKCKKCGETHKTRKEQTNCEAERKLLIEAARAQYQSDEIEIDSPATISRGEGGIWVQAWVWVANEG